MPGNETRFAVLLFTDIVGSTGLKTRHGIPAYSEALRTHNGHFERLAHKCLYTRTLQGRGDGYFAEAGSVTEAVRFALLFQEALREGPWGEMRLTARVGIHAGEVATLNPEGDVWIVAPAADLAARVADLALGGQILLTRVSFDEARHFVREHPAATGKTMPPLCWLAHGPYLMKGCDEPLEVFEVGAEGLAPLVAPPDGEKAKRAIRPGEEETLGWRPAVGLEIPGRTGWHLIERLGVGGFGEVWTGEHTKLSQRRAFKFCFDDERLRALKREVTLVRLLRSALGERDDIVHLHELKLDAPPFYLESDLAPHGNLLQWAEKQGGLDHIPLAQRIALVAYTATALAAAHSIGVLHKDIKPTNILIFEGPDGGARPRLVDFGIGSLADPAVLGQHGVTAAGFTRATIQHSTGTPTYSPPEYLAGRPYTVQGDIYGLGVLLYQLATAKPLDPLAPGWERDISDPLLCEDIAACVDGDPARRLPSAADLAERLSHLDQRRAEIVEKERLAREVATRAEAEAAALAARSRATRFRRLAAVFAVLTFLALIGGVLARINQKKATTALAEVERKKGEVEAKKAEVDRKNAEYRAMLAEAARSDRLVAEEKLLAGKEPEAFAHLARACEYDPASAFAAEKVAAALNTWQQALPKAILAGHEGNVHDTQFSPDGTRIVTASGDMTARVWDTVTGRSLITLAGHEGPVQSARFSPDGARIVTASWDRTARVWDSATGRSLATLTGHAQFVQSAQFSPDGSRIVTASDDKTARLWDAATGKTLAVLAGHADIVLRAAFSPNSSFIITVSGDSIVRVWDAMTGKSLATLTEGSALNAQFSPDGTRILTTPGDKTARVWDATTGGSLATLAGHEGSVLRAEFSPDSSLIVTLSRDKTARVWDAATGKSLATLAEHEGSVSSARFSPDGARIVTTSEDKTARVWDAATGRTVATLTGHNAGVLSAQFSPDGSLIVTVSKDETARLWDVATGRSLASLRDYDGFVRSVQFSPDGTHIAITGIDSVRVWDTVRKRDLVSSRDPCALVGHEGVVSSAQFSPDGTRIVTASHDKSARVWDAASGQSLTTLSGHQRYLFSAQFSRDGARIVTASRDGTARVWDASTGRSLITLAGGKAGVMSAQFSPNGDRIVTALADNTAQVWDTVTGNRLAALVGHTSWLHSAEFSSDATRIVTSSEDKTARVWDAAKGTSLATLTGHDDAALNAQFSPDGTRIVTLARDKTARVWDTASGRSLATLVGHQGGVRDTQFSPDGTRIVAVASDRTPWLWNAATGQSLAALTGHRGRVNSVQFSSDGTRIVTAGDDSARVWDAATGQSLTIFPGSAVSAQFSPDGSRIVTSSSDGSARIWSILPPSAGLPPEWFPDFLRYIAQMRLNPDGQLEALKPKDWLALRERMRGVEHAGAGQDTPYLRILRRFVAE